MLPPEMEGKALRISMAQFPPGQPGISKWIALSPDRPFARMIASRSEQSTMHSPSFSSDTVSTVKIVGTSVFVTGSDKVGIGTSAPSAALDVAGDVKVLGQITAATQPAFLARKPSNNQDQFEINTGVDVTLSTEDFDVGSNFASNTYTAPTTGVYIFTANVYLTNLDTDATNYSLDLVTSAGIYRLAIIDPGAFCS